MFWVWNYIGGIRLFGYFSRLTHVHPHQWEALAETFLMMWLNTGLPRKITKIRTTPVLVSHPKQVYMSLKRVFGFYCAYYRDSVYRYSTVFEPFEERRQFDIYWIKSWTYGGPKFILNVWGESITRRRSQNSFPKKTHLTEVATARIRAEQSRAESP